MTPTASSIARQAAKDCNFTASLSKPLEEREAVILTAFSDLLRVAQVREALERALSCQEATLEIHGLCGDEDTEETEALIRSALAALDSMMTKEPQP